MNEMITPTQIILILTTITRYQRSLLEDIFRASGADDALTVSWCHKQPEVEAAFCALGKMGLLQCEGSDWDWDRAWVHPSNLAHDLFCLEDARGSRWIEPRDAWDCRMVNEEQLPLFVDNGEERWRL